MKVCESSLLSISILVQCRTAGYHTLVTDVLATTDRRDDTRMEIGVEERGRLRAGGGGSKTEIMGVTTPRIEMRQKVL